MKTIKAFLGIIRSSAYGLNPFWAKNFGVVITMRENDFKCQRSLILDRLNVDLILDVGGHFGEFYEEIRKYGYENEVFSVEPTPQSYQKLAAAGRGDKKFTSLNSALSNFSGTLKMNQFTHSDMNSALDVDPDTDYSIERTYNSIEVPWTTIDELIENQKLLGKKIFLKLDVQGFELVILEGLQKYLHLVVGIQIEVSVNAIYSSASNLVGFQTWADQNGFSISTIETERFQSLHLQAFDVDVIALRVS
jgi:FkbM family methyltransferase